MQLVTAVADPSFITPFLGGNKRQYGRVYFHVHSAIPLYPRGVSATGRGVGQKR